MIPTFFGEIWEGGKEFPGHEDDRVAHISLVLKLKDPKYCKESKSCPERINDAFSVPVEMTSRCQCSGSSLPARIIRVLGAGSSTLGQGQASARGERGIVVGV